MPLLMRNHPAWTFLQLNFSKRSAVQSAHADIITNSLQPRPLVVMPLSVCSLHITECKPSNINCPSSGIYKVQKYCFTLNLNSWMDPNIKWYPTLNSFFWVLKTCKLKWWLPVRILSMFQTHFLQNMAKDSASQSNLAVSTPPAEFYCLLKLGERVRNAFTLEWHHFQFRTAGTPAPCHPMNKPNKSP